MSKYTERNLKKHAVFRWNQDMQKFIVYPLSWGFFHVKEWSLLNVNRSFWIIYWNPVPGADGYRVYKYNANEGAWKNIKEKRLIFILLEFQIIYLSTNLYYKL